MYIVWERTTGHSDESMRFATRPEAVGFIESTPDPDDYSIRFED